MKKQGGDVLDGVFEIERDSRSKNRHNSYGTSKAHILEAAVKVFSEQGFSRSTLKDVANHSKANTALIGYHFGNKEGLQKAVVEGMLQQAAEALEEALKAPMVDLSNFELVLENLITFSERDNVFFRLLEWCMLDGGPESNQVFHVFVNRLLRRWVEWLKQLRPELDAAEIETRVIYIFCSIRQFANYRILSHERFAEIFYSKSGQKLCTIIETN